MKPGARALGIAESYAGEQSTLAGVVTRADRAVDGFAFENCTVGGTDGTDAVCSLISELDREDVRYVILSGLALAWYNVLDLHTIADHAELPVLSVTYEESEGLAPAMRREFSGEALDVRLETYRRQPTRKRIAVNDETLFVRAVDLDAGRARQVVEAFTPAGGRPEPLRVARLAARAADRWRADS